MTIKKQVYRLSINRKGELTVKREDGIERKRKYTIRNTDWIYHLKKGEYTMQQIKDISGSNNKTSLLKKMVKYGATIESIFDEKKKIVKNLFIWKGLKQEEE